MGETLPYLNAEWHVKGRKEQGSNEYKKPRATMIKAKLLWLGICEEDRKKIKPYEEPKLEKI